MATVYCPVANRRDVWEARSYPAGVPPGDVCLRMGWRLEMPPGAWVFGPGGIVLQRGPGRDPRIADPEPVLMEAAAQATEAIVVAEALPEKRRAPGRKPRSKGRSVAKRE